MCLSCGCGRPSDRHGNPDNIVVHDLERAAEVDSISIKQVVDNIAGGSFKDGHEDYIQRHDIERAARAANISTEQVIANIKKTIDQYVARSRPVHQEAASDAGPG